MAIGILVTKGEIDSRMGGLARDFQGIFSDLLILKSFFDATPNADLETLGYTPNEVAVLKSAIADLNQLYEISTGRQTLTEAKDFTTFVRQLWGVGAQ